MPYASGALSELYEELEAEKEEYKILHKKINDIFLKIKSLCDFYYNIYTKLH